MIELSRYPLGFHNPNHAAALACAVLPLCWGWRRCAWLGNLLAGGLLALLLLTQSRTGLLVAGLEVVAWWWGSRRGAARSASAPSRRRWLWIVSLALSGVALWWMGPRLALDGSILNRPKIWLAGLQLFAANPRGVGLGNSGTLASAFLLDGIPEVRTMISAHITLLAEFGWIVGWAWLAFIGLALCGVRECPRIGLAFTGLVLSGCSSTVFDWPVLFDFAEQGGLGMMNWVLSWGMFLMFVGFGVWLIAGVVRRTRRVLPTIAMLALAGVTVLGLRLVPIGNAPQVCDGYVVCGESPRTLALYDATWKLKTVARRVTGGAVMPVRGVLRFPFDLDLRGVDRVLLFGTCREWAHLVKGGVPVSCVGN
ncbi:MAG: hypothetical protein Q4G65_14895 [bacterium]|nr:hypothetical protein [bacterium]